MIQKLAIAAIVLGLVGVIAFWFLSSPQTLAASALPDRKPDLANGAYMFRAGGCESCHAALDAKGDDQLKLGGGQVLATSFGKFSVPDISPDPDHGIGKWTILDFVNALKFGVRPDKAHLYPAFPFTSYQRMTLADIVDLKGYLDTLPPVANPVPAHELSFPFNIRRGVGLWKLLYIDGADFHPDPKASAEINRGAYLVTGPGHCGECHTPRNFFGGPIASRAYSGGPAPAGDGYVPNITPDKETGIGAWSNDDIVQLLETGFTPTFDVIGGDMTGVVENTAKLTPQDRAAIAAYLKTLPAIHNPRPPKKAATPTG
jgi:mono/diheme cytochrome c family protein